VEILESIAYIALGFVPTLALLDISYRMGRKSAKRKTAVSITPPAIARSFSKLQL
jgi:hypothetical protein